jgi:hypothetical protein
MDVMVKIRSARARARRTWAPRALLPVLLLEACGAPQSGPHTPGAPATDAAGTGGDAGAGTTPAAAPSLVEEIEALVSGHEATAWPEVHSLAVELAADWTREAGHDHDAADVLALLRRELAAKLLAVRGSASGAEIDVMRGEVYDRRARALSRRSFTLGKGVIDGTIPDATARTAGHQILREVAALMPQIRALHDPARVRVLSGDLQEVSLEATFAVDRGGMSRRLSDYRSTRTPASDIH